LRPGKQEGIGGGVMMSKSQQLQNRGTRFKSVQIRKTLK
jgi:hypothetical protein